ncbi:MAG: serine/threonine protein kinase [Pirellulales bacterium]|nr:serine/threonine protein kinase [Pirellulales bacterium]
MQFEKLGPYRIGKKICKGGMGTVYQAVSEIADESRGLQVAVKALNPQLAMADGFRDRFEAEIDSLKKLDHPGIVHLFGYGEQDGILFYSMELVEGTSLEEEINAGRRFDWHETLQIGIQICRALKHAHDHGVIHRDIKPANLMLTSEGQIKIADFGIARLFGGTQLTTAGGVLGTANYMSPEQADGSAVTESCDQYSLGGVLYALLAGRPPFRAKTMPEMLQMQRFAAPEPVSHYAPDTPAQLDKLLGQLLAKDPLSRFPNVLVLSRHMEAMAKALSRPAEPTDDENGHTGVEAAYRIDLDSESNLQDLPTQTIDPTASAASVAKVQELSPDVYEGRTPPRSDELASSEHPEPTGADFATPTEPQPRATHFTTVDNDVRQRRETAREHRLARLAQLSALALAIGALIGGGWYLTRPQSADELVATIHAEIEKRGTDDLRYVADPLKEFFTRFPNDPRAAKLIPYRQQLDFQHFVRDIRIKSRVAGQAGLSPVENVYFRSMAQAETSPGDAAAKLRALVALYDPQNATLDPDTAKFTSDQRLLIVARAQIKKLTASTQQAASAELPALRKRMAAAAKIQQTNPRLAGQMYEAIIVIYSEKKWAQQIVAEARAAAQVVGPTRNTN